MVAPTEFPQRRADDPGGVTFRTMVEYVDRRFLDLHASLTAAIADVGREMRVEISALRGELAAHSRLHLDNLQRAQDAEPERRINTGALIAAIALTVLALASLVTSVIALWHH